MKLYEKAGGSFLDIASCGSSIRWRCHASHRKPTEKTPCPQPQLQFEIDLTDCSRSIEWVGYTPSVAKKKLRAAIREFQRALRSVEAAHVKIKAAKAHT